MRRTTHRRAAWIGAALVILGAAGAGVVALRAWARPRSPYADLPRATVRRASVEDVVVVGGEVEGAKRTTIECELDALPFAPGLPGGTLPTLIELVPDGSVVAEGDVLCRFDASGYEEAARTQEIAVEKARAEDRQAGLELEAAEYALRAYRDGESLQLADTLRGQIAQMESDLKAARDRLQWSRLMRDTGYLSADALAAAESSALRMDQGLKDARGNYRNHRLYTVPRAVRELEVRVENARKAAEFAREQLESQEGRLETYRERVESCTVTAPHAGRVIYFDVMFGPEFKLREGIQVHRGMPMMYLPDLSDLVIEFTLHETVAPRVKAGMPATVRIEAFPGRELTGTVAHVAQLPTEDWRKGVEIKLFEARITLDQAPEGALPGMSASIRIVTGRTDDALVVPIEAVAVEDGRDVCYVAAGDALERREVVVRRAGHFDLRVESGLDEGDQVILNPADLPDGMAPPPPVAVARGRAARAPRT